MPNIPRYLEHDGRRQTLDEWACETRIPASTIRSRLKLGWPVARVLTTPVDRRFRRGGRARSDAPRPCPRMRRQMPQGRAFVEWVAFGDRHKVYLGQWGSAEAKREYRRFAAEWAAGRYAAARPGPDGPSVGALVVRWLEHCRLTYRKRGTITSEVHANRAAMAALVELYGDTPAGEFDCLRLEAVQREMLEKGYARNTINGYCTRIVRCYSWAVTKKLVPAAVADALKHFPPLVAGRTRAAEAKPRKPVPADHTDAIVEHLHPDAGRRAVLAAMVRFQLLTGMRPGELVAMRPEDLDRSDELWKYEPADGGKMYHLEKSRKIWLGPRAQAVLAPLLGAAEPGQPVFRLPPCREEKWSPLTVKRYREYIKGACKAAGVPVWTPHRLRHTRATEVMRRYESDAAAGAAIGDTPEVARQIYVDNPADAVAKRIARELG